MNQLSREQLEELLQASEGISISIYLPTERRGAETQQNPIRFKNQLREAEARLTEKGLDKTLVADLLDPLRRLVDDHEFWQHQDDGLAVFRSADRFEHHRLPSRFNELVVVNDHFYLKPLFRLIQADGRFYVLALSLHDVRLLEATRYGCRRITLGDDVPQSLVDAVGGELEEPHIQYHSGNGGSAPIYHGQGGGEDDQKPEIKAFLQRLDRALDPYLRDRAAPIVLAGVDYLRAFYREVSHHHRVLEEGVAGSPDKVRDEELQEKGWEVARSVLTAEREQARERFHNLASSGKASTALDELIPAAFDGRIDTLFVARGERQWGRFDQESREIELLDDEHEEADDLLDVAAVRTFMNGGTVFALEGAELPENGKPVAAIFRY